MRGAPYLRYSTNEICSASNRDPRRESDTEPADRTIRQMARLFDVSLRTLRYYEGRGLIAPRREGHARLYRAADQARIEMILQAKKLGFTLAEISGLIGGTGSNDTPDPGKQPQSHPHPACSA